MQKIEVFTEDAERIENLCVTYDVCEATLIQILLDAVEDGDINLD